MGIRGLVRRCRNRDLPDFLAKRKLLRGLRGISKLPEKELKSVDAVVDAVRGIGLRYDARGLYGTESTYMNRTHNGLWQIPQQIAKAMVLLSGHKIGSFLEIGTHSGYTFSVLSAYLHRLNPNLEALSVDPVNLFRHYSTIKSLLPVEYKTCTSEELKGRVFDFVLIDGNHDYEAVRTDFENVGQYARLCMFHDINDELVGEENVPMFWKELVADNVFEETHEFLDCAAGKRVMGIGVGIRKAA